MREFLEGSRAVAEVVGVCGVQVVAAYPITPQTHIVEEISQMVADGDIKAEYLRVESEFAAASVVLGASATGARTYTCTTSQGLLLMNEVLYNISGLRLPVVLTCVNRAISPPINIWCDHSDSMTVRDACWITFYAEDVQEAADLILQAYRVGEDRRVLLPVMINMDGFILSHCYEPVEMWDHEDVRRYLPPYDPPDRLDPADPKTFGGMGGPDVYMEARFALENAIANSKEVIIEAAEEFRSIFGRGGDALVEGYRLEGAETVVVAMGSVLGTIKDVIDELREGGEKVGLLKVRCFRPFPAEEVAEALLGRRHVAILDRSISYGAQGPLATDIKASLYGLEGAPPLSCFIVGLGGRDITKEDIRNVIEKAREGPVTNEFVALNWDLLEVIPE